MAQQQQQLAAQQQQWQQAQQTSQQFAALQPQALQHQQQFAGLQPQAQPQQQLFGLQPPVSMQQYSAAQHSAQPGAPPPLHYSHSRSLSTGGPCTMRSFGQAQMGQSASPTANLRAGASCWPD